MRTLSVAGASVVVAIVFAAFPASAQITYELAPVTTPLGYTADGWVRTDGTLGDLEPANFVAFEIAIENDIGSMLTLDETNSNVDAVGVSASATDLSFDGSDPNSFGSEEFEVNGPPGFKLDLEYGNGASMTYSTFLRIDGIGNRGETPIAELPVPLAFASVPEPRAALLLLVGVATLAAGRRTLR